jgi:hypothetical protein
LYTSGRDSVTIVIGPLRVTLENFSSMVASLLFRVFLWRGMPRYAVRSSILTQARGAPQAGRAGLSRFADLTLILDNDKK